MADQILVFMLDDQPFALSLPGVVKVIHAVEIRHLPKAPEIISGIINVNGRIIPVADIRKRFGLAEHEIVPDDRFIIADTGKREIAILADSISGIMDLTAGPQEQIRTTLPFAEHLRGVAKIDEGLVLIYDLDRFLSLDEENELEKALKTKKK
jgi:purine-binding chemotaxis protein CheW